MPNVVHGFAYANGPVSGATVSVYSPRGKLLARKRGGTEQSGTFFLRAPKLPPDFRVVVTGGSHLGKPFKDELRAEVRGDTSQVVHVSQVSTIASHRLEQNPKAGLNTAESKVKAHLKIPAGLDVGDVRVNRRYFSGRKFHQEAKRRGGTAKLTQATARDAGSGVSPHPYRDGGKPGARITPQELLDSLVESAKEKVSGDVAGWVLSELSKSLPLPESELDKINRELMAINAQLTEIKAELGEISKDLKDLGYSQIVAQLPLAEIDHVQNEELWLIAHPTSAERKSVIDDLVRPNGYIETHLQDAPERFNRAFTGGFDQTKLVDAYGQVALKKSPNVPFFTPADNAKVFDAYSYYDLYLLQALNAVVEWRHAKGETDRPKSLIDDVVVKRRTVYEPTRPEKLDPDGVLDTRSKLQWQNRAHFGLNFRAAAARIQEERQSGLDWEFPGPDTYGALLRDRGGQNPCDYLRPKGFGKALDPRLCQRDPEHVAWGDGMGNCQQPGPQSPRFVKSLELASGEVTCHRFDTNEIALFYRKDGSRYW
jgi:hypothetical protein